jgi:hypothetical protein
MEPIDSVAMDERDMIYCDMGSAEIATILDRAQAEIPLAVGVNNHMGSKATADSALMAKLADEFQRRGLFFIDSRTVAHSFGLPNMRRRGVSSQGRDVFLDFTDDPKIIRRQVHQAARIAEKRGWAIAIGHVRWETLDVLEREMPILQEQGYQFVSVSRLLETFVDHSHHLR